MCFVYNKASNYPFVHVYFETLMKVDIVRFKCTQTNGYLLELCEKPESSWEKYEV